MSKLTDTWDRMSTKTTKFFPLTVEFQSPYVSLYRRFDDRRVLLCCTYGPPHLRTRRRLAPFDGRRRRLRTQRWPPDGDHRWPTASRYECTHVEFQIGHKRSAVGTKLQRVTAAGGRGGGSSDPEGVRRREQQLLAPCHVAPPHGGGGGAAAPGSSSRDKRCPNTAHQTPPHDFSSHPVALNVYQPGPPPDPPPPPIPIPRISIYTAAALGGTGIGRCDLRLLLLPRPAHPNEASVRRRPWHQAQTRVACHAAVRWWRDPGEVGAACSRGHDVRRVVQSPPGLRPLCRQALKVGPRRENRSGWQPDQPDGAAHGVRLPLALPLPLRSRAGLPDRLLTPAAHSLAPSRFPVGRTTGTISSGPRLAKSCIRRATRPPQRPS